MKTVAVYILCAAILYFAARLLTFVENKQKPRGIDINFAKKQKWWEEVYDTVMTDEATTRSLVEIIYLNVCDGKIAEIEYLRKLLTQTQDVEQALGELAKRQGTIEHFSQPENLKDVQL